VLDKLGEGAMGVVYAGYDRSLDRKVALKLVRRQLLDKPAVRTRMTREAQAMARLSNPHVVQVYQVGEHDGGIYVAMEYIDGQTLGQWLRAEPRAWQRCCGWSARRGAGWRRRTRPGWCTATSSPTTCWSTLAVRRGSSTSGSCRRSTTPRRTRARRPTTRR
jgi:hypothetical protein